MVAHLWLVALPEPQNIYSNEPPPFFLRSLFPKKKQQNTGKKYKKVRYCVGLVIRRSNRIKMVIHYQIAILS